MRHRTFVSSSSKWNLSKSLISLVSALEWKSFLSFDDIVDAVPVLGHFVMVVILAIVSWRLREVIVKWSHAWSWSDSWWEIRLVVILFDLRRSFWKQIPSIHIVLTFNLWGKQWPFLTGIKREKSLTLIFLSLISVDSRVFLTFVVVSNSLEHFLFEIEEFIHELGVLITCKRSFWLAVNSIFLSVNVFVTTTINTLSVDTEENLFFRIYSIFDWPQVFFWIFACFLSFLLH